MNFLLKLYRKTIQPNKKIENEISTPSIKKLGHIIANRRDGLGERLCAVFNAMFISELTGQEFKFLWPPFNGDKQFHSVFNEREVFSEGFIDNYLVSRVYRSPIAFRHGRESLVDLKNDCIKKIELGHLVASQRDFLSNIKNEEKNIQLVKDLVLLKLKFSDRIETIKEYVSKIDIARNLCAVHIRSGDLVYGKNAELRVYISKVLPTPLISALIKSNALEGPYILFGQEAEYTKKMHDLGYALDANTLRPPEFDSALDRAMFDIFLMARCQRVLTGSSGFSRFSRFIGSPVAINLKDIWTSKEIAENVYTEITANESFYNSHQIAYSAYFAHECVARDGDTLFLAELLEIATTFSPNNILYRFLLIFSFYKMGKFSLADNIVRGWERELGYVFFDFLNEQRTREILEIKTTYRGSVSVFNIDIPSMQLASENGSVYAKSILSVIQSASSPT